MSLSAPQPELFPDDVLHTQGAQGFILAVLGLSNDQIIVSVIYLLQTLPRRTTQ